MRIKDKPHSFLAGPWPAVIGHRGAAGIAPENTIESFTRALADGAGIIECDLRLTKDGEIVVIHDPAVDRTTDGTGAIRDRTLAELKRLDAGHNFTTDGGASFPFRGQGHTIPALADVLAFFPDTRFCLEIKDKGQALAEKVIDMAINYRLTGNIMLATFSFASQLHIYRHLARTGADIPVAASKFEAAMAVAGARFGLGPPHRVDIFAVPPESHGVPILTRRFCDYIHCHGGLISAWTIDDMEEMEKLLGRGVDAIVTNYPARAAPLVAGARGSRHEAVFQSPTRA